MSLNAVLRELCIYKKIFVPGPWQSGDTIAAWIIVAVVQKRCIDEGDAAFPDSMSCRSLVECKELLRIKCQRCSRIVELAMSDATCIVSVYRDRLAILALESFALAEGVRSHESEWTPQRLVYQQAPRRMERPAWHRWHLRTICFRLN